MTSQWSAFRPPYRSRATVQQSIVSVFLSSLPEGPTDIYQGSFTLGWSAKREISIWLQHANYTPITTQPRFETRPRERISQFPLFKYAQRGYLKINLNTVDVTVHIFTHKCFIKTSSEWTYSDKCPLKYCCKFHIIFPARTTERRRQAHHHTIIYITVPEFNTKC